MSKFAAWDWDGGEFIPLMTDNIVEAIYTAWNYEFDVYENNRDSYDLIFSGTQDNEWNSEMLEKYGIRVIDHEKHRHLQNIETGEIYFADWQKEMG
ncbi:hypothetical protein GCM10008014_08520 [Paenibacillus silvae]|uniref:YubB ferredoxin-like domain-containing protein n=1 Tax=Paenibacillus silvae TaxID=1325358 RepID=A0ABQ1Z397_9BACL|nr:hypothetical protein [Paenibacillus silvae]GGH46088.1 hypothetical protein GCM10008014_08520 [Paenibacillus silvae]